MRERDARELVQSARNGAMCVRYVFDRHGKVSSSPGDEGPALVPAALLLRARRIAFGAAANRAAGVQRPAG